MALMCPQDDSSGTVQKPYGAGTVEEEEKFQGEKAPKKGSLATLSDLSDTKSLMQIFKKIIVFYP